MIYDCYVFTDGIVFKDSEETRKKDVLHRLHNYIEEHYLLEESTTTTTTILQNNIIYITVSKWGYDTAKKCTIQMTTHPVQKAVKKSI